MDVATAGQQTCADPFMDVPLMYCANQASCCMLLFPAGLAAERPMQLEGIARRLRGQMIS